MTRAKLWRWAAMGGLICALAAGASPAVANSRSQALYAKGLVPFHNGRWDDAYTLFDDAVKADPNDALALYYRGLTAARRGQPAQAIPDLERAAQLDPRLAHVALDLGITYFDAGQYPEARRWLEQAYQSATDRYPAAFFLGLTHYRQDDFAGARPYLTEAEKDPDLRSQAHYYAGLALLREGKESEGRAALEQATQGRAETETARAAQSYLAGAREARKPPVPEVAAEAKPWEVFASAGFEYDSNVVLAPSDSAIAQSTHQEDGRSTLGFGGRYRLLGGEAGYLTASYDFYQSLHFRLHEFDLQGHRVRLQGLTIQGPVQLGLATSYDFYALNYQSFFHEVLVTPWLTIPEGPSASTQVYYTFRGRDFFRKPYDPSRDSMDNALGIRQYLMLGRQDRLLSAGYQFDSDESVSRFHIDDSGVLHRNEFQAKAHQFDVGVEMPLAEIATGQLSYLFRVDDYQFPNSRAVPAFGYRRHDSEHQVVAALSRDLTAYAQVTLAYLGVLNSSNVKSFDYDRNIVSLSVRLHF